MEKKESSPCHHSPNPSTPNAYPSPAIPLESHFFSPSPALPQPAWKILFTAPITCILSSPWLLNKASALGAPRPPELNICSPFIQLCHFIWLKMSPAHPPAGVAERQDQLGIPLLWGMSCPHSPVCAHGGSSLHHRQWHEGRQSRGCAWSIHSASHLPCPYSGNDPKKPWGNAMLNAPSFSGERHYRPTMGSQRHRCCSSNTQKYLDCFFMDIFSLASLLAYALGSSGKLFLGRSLIQTRLCSHETR